MKKIFFFICLFVCSNLYSQNIKIQMCLDSCINPHEIDSIYYKFSNFSDEDYWIFKSGISMNLMVTDSIGNRLTKNKYIEQEQGYIGEDYFLMATLLKF